MFHGILYDTDYIVLGKMLRPFVPVGDPPIPRHMAASILPNFLAGLWVLAFFPVVVEDVVPRLGGEFSFKSCWQFVW